MQLVDENNDMKRVFESVAPIKVRAIHCTKCGSIVYSRCASDKRTCLCGAVSVSGGVIPTELTCHLPELYEWLDIVVDKDLNDMYYDWNLSIDRLGMVYPKGNRKHVTGMKYILTIHDNSGHVLYIKGMA